MSDLRPNITLAILSILGIIVSAWLLVNYEPERTGLIFVVLSGLSFLVSVTSNLLESFLRVTDTGEGPMISLRQVGLQAISGIFLGALPILASVLYPFTIGLPNFNMSVSGNFLISVLVAPLVEEPFFLFVVPFLLLVLALRLTDSKGISMLIAFVGGCFIFAGFHWLAYGATFLVSGAFIGAMIFRAISLMAVLVVSMREGEAGFNIQAVAPVIVTTIVMHAIFNAYVLTSTLSVTGVPG